MKTFKKRSDINQLPHTHNAFFIIQRLIDVLIVEYELHGVKHNPSEDGYIILLEKESDPLEEISSYWHQLQDIEFDGISRINDQYLYAPYIGTDQYGLAFVIPTDILPEEMHSLIHDTITF
ncbi:MAG: hypothetical protein HND53_05375 [Proteobacteria bacterium]|nr:hypothetical protein [Pseudomonadota bacterium]NOG59912.1 hypothetical protein [Pseudomonadota bacterium]